MAGEAQDNIWPLPKFYFKVEVDGGITASFQEVSGLDTETDVTEYRHGDSPDFTSIPVFNISSTSCCKISLGNLYAGIPKASMPPN